MILNNQKQLDLEKIKSDINRIENNQSIKELITDFYEKEKKNFPYYSNKIKELLINIKDWCVDSCVIKTFTDFYNYFPITSLVKNWVNNQFWNCNKNIDSIQHTNLIDDHQNPPTVIKSFFNEIGLPFKHSLWAFEAHNPHFIKKESNYIL